MSVSARTKYRENHGTVNHGAIAAARTKLVAIRRPIDVGRPNGKRKIKMIPYPASRAPDIEHAAVVNGMLMMRVPIKRDADKRQIVYNGGEYRSLKTPELFRSKMTSV